MRNMRLTSIRYHRNGIFGRSFWAVAFQYKEDRRNHRMVAAVFDDQEMAAGEVHPCTGRVAVLDAAQSAAGDVSPRWRGDNFEPQLRQWIAQEDARLTAERYDLRENDARYEGILRENDAA